jgi:fermentation-respiration switch protein FrsA (DUF1100 family)
LQQALKFQNNSIVVLRYDGAVLLILGRIRVAAGIAGAVVLIALGVWFYAPRYFYNRIIRRRAPIPGTSAFRMAEECRAAEEPSWIDEQPHERASIVSHDGLVLEGFFAAAARAGLPVSGDTVILAHGYTGDARQLSGIARGFYERLGCNVLLPHARGHGSSGGDHIGFGWPDRLDYLRWIDWVIKRTDSRDGEVRVVLFGMSMGAATVLMTGGEEALQPEVKLIIEDCGYTSAEDELRYQVARFYHLKKADWLLKVLSRYTEKRAGYNLAEASALNQVKKIKIPVLFIHGDADIFVPFEMVQTLYDACPSARELYAVKGAGHGKACETDIAEYERRIAAFLEKYMGKKSSY